jgi:oxygen-independent coproporphyrinogen-3 oxidase
VEQDLPPGQIGLYIHIPWCLSRCGYCSFYALPFRRQDFAEYFATLLKEKQLHLDAGIPRLSTVYFGGGTPSLLSPLQINTLLEGIALSPDAEITLEINPIQITQEYAAALSQTPVNRISLGVQSMLDEDLAYLTRRHKAEAVAGKVRILREAGFRNISADFIYGLPASDVRRVRHSLDLLLAIPFEHISSYLLELYEDTPLGKDAARLPEDEECAAQYSAICQMLAAAGFTQYEISNFARSGRESRHNLLYWEGHDFLAWGASASGYYRGTRYQNPPDLAQYYQYIQAGRIYGKPDPEAKPEADYIMMRLRLCRGLSLAEFQQRFGQDFQSPRAAAIKRLQSQGLILCDSESIRLSPAAYFISNSVIADLL